MAIPEGYTKLAVIGYSDKGSYSAATTYNKYNVVYYNGSSYVCLKDNLTGVTPSNDKVNWRLMAQGFATLDAANIDTADTPNITGGGAGKKTKLQSIIDKLADWWIAKLAERLVNNGTTTNAGYALDARFGKTLQDQVSELNAKTSFSSIPGVGNKITIPTDIYNTYTVFGVNIRVDGSGQQVQTVLKNFEFTWSVDTGISDFYAKGNGSWNGNIITITKSAGKDITSVYAFPIK